MTIVDGVDVIPIPMSYFRDFKSDPLEALLKYGSLPQRAHSPWFTNLRSVEAVLSGPDYVCGPKAEQLDPIVHYKSLIGAPYRENEPGSATIMLDGLAPNFVCNDDYYWHVAFDMGLGKKRQGDAAGIAMGRLADARLEVYTDPVSGLSSERIVRTYEVPLVAQIIAPTSDQIYLSSVVRFILQLKQLRGFNITSFSADGFEHAGTGQELTLAGLVTAGMTIDPLTGEVTGVAKPFSVDRTDGPYRELLEVVNDHRVILPAYELLRKEMRELEFIDAGAAPDHPVTGSKEASDAVAGVVGYLAQFGHAELELPGTTVVDRRDLEEQGWDLGESIDFTRGQRDQFDWDTEAETVSFNVPNGLG